ncbi:MAG TPA: cation:proton antiporter [Acidimicrobiales bacterium]|nr:cation:proton antiporter [Acidimicrobiales bacterium]
MPNHDLLVLWTQLAALLLAARLLGALANRIGQPAVAGELTAGLLLGPSVFGHLWPHGFSWVFPHSGGSPGLQALVAVSLAGLLVSIGAETDLPLIRRLGKAAGWVTSASLAVPLAAGVGVALLLPAALRGHTGGIAPFVILVAGAVAVSSLPVIAKIVSDLGLMRRNVGQLAVATGTVHDAIGFVLVALATGLAARGGGSGDKVVVALVGVAGISVLLLTVGQRLFDLSLRVVRRNGPSVTGSLGVCLVGSLVAAAAMQAFGVEGALGAFVAGVALGRSRFQVGRAIGVMQSMTSTFFAPIYFAAAGLRVNLGVLGRGEVALAFVAIFVVALVAKFAGAVLGARVAGLPHRELAALGVVLNGRGALQVVIATAGLSAGVLQTSSYTILILMSVASSLAVPPLLRLAMRGWEGTAEERDRLVREELMEQNVVVRGQRLLLAGRGSDSSILAAEVLAAAWPQESAVTVLTIGDEGTARQGGGADGKRPQVQAILDVLADRPVDHRNLPAGEVAEQILGEANLGYGAIALGASDEQAGAHLLSPVLDELLMRSPLPLVIVRRARNLDRPLPAAFTKVLVPVSGSPSSRAGQEVACNMALSLGTRVVLAHVVTRTVNVDSGVASSASSTRRGIHPVEAPPRRVLAEAEGAAQVVLRGAWDMAIETGVEPQMVVRHGRSAGDEILALAGEVGADVITVGTTVRHVDGRPFLGHTVEQVLTHSSATVVVVALPEQSTRLGSVMAEAAGVA